MYHLKQLIAKRLVEKTAAGYGLTPEGLSYIDKISFTTKHPALQPKLIIYLQITDKSGHRLFWRRSIQPSIGRVGLPVGKIHYGEDAYAAAERELSEKTGLKDVKLAYLGTVNLKFFMKDTLISHIFCLIFSGQTKTDQPKLTGSHKGEVFWSKDEALEGLLPSVKFIDGLLADSTNKNIFAEKSFYL